MYYSLTVLLIAVVGSQAILRVSDDVVLLPCIPRTADAGTKVSYNITVSPGDFSFKSSVRNTVELTKYHGKLSVVSAHRCDGTLVSHGSFDVSSVTGETAHISLIIAPIADISIVTRTDMLTVQENHLLQLQAFDKDANMFSSLQGLHFKWTLGNPNVIKTLDSFEMIEVPDFYTAHPGLRDKVAVKGIGMGNTTVKAELTSNDFAVATTRTVCLVQPITVVPNSPITYPGSVVVFLLSAHGSSSYVSRKTAYTIISTDRSVAELVPTDTDDFLIDAHAVGDATLFVKNEGCIHPFTSTGITVTLPVDYHVTVIDSSGSRFNATGREYFSLVNGRIYSFEVTLMSSELEPMRFSNVLTGDMVESSDTSVLLLKDAALSTERTQVFGKMRPSNLGLSQLSVHGDSSLSSIVADVLMDVGVCTNLMWKNTTIAHHIKPMETASISLLTQSRTTIWLGLGNCHLQSFNVDVPKHALASETSIVTANSVTDAYVDLRTLDNVGSYAVTFKDFNSVDNLLHAQVNVYAQPSHILEVGSSLKNPASNKAVLLNSKAVIRYHVYGTEGVCLTDLSTSSVVLHTESTHQTDLVTMDLEERSISSPCRVVAVSVTISGTKSRRMGVRIAVNGIFSSPITVSGYSPIQLASNQITIREGFSRNIVWTNGPMSFMESSCSSVSSKISVGASYMDSKATLPSPMSGYLDIQTTCSTTGEASLAVKCLKPSEDLLRAKIWMKFEGFRFEDSLDVFCVGDPTFSDNIAHNMTQFAVKTVNMASIVSLRIFNVDNSRNCVDVEQGPGSTSFQLTALELGKCKFAVVVSDTSTHFGQADIPSLRWDFTIFIGLPALRICESFPGSMMLGFEARPALCRDGPHGTEWEIPTALDDGSPINIEWSVSNKDIVMLRSSSLNSREYGKLAETYPRIVAKEAGSSTVSANIVMRDNVQSVSSAVTVVTGLHFFSEYDTQEIFEVVLPFSGLISITASIPIKDIKWDVSGDSVVTRKVTRDVIELTAGRVAGDMRLIGRSKHGLVKSINVVVREPKYIVASPQASASSENTLCVRESIRFDVYFTDAIGQRFTGAGFTESSEDKLFHVTVGQSSAVVVTVSETLSSSAPGVIGELVVTPARPLVNSEVLVTLQGGNAFQVAPWYLYVKPCGEEYHFAQVRLSINPLSLLGIDSHSQATKTTWVMTLEKQLKQALHLESSEKLTLERIHAPQGLMELVLNSDRASERIGQMRTFDFKAHEGLREITFNDAKLISAHQPSRNVGWDGLSSESEIFAIEYIVLGFVIIVLFVSIGSCTDQFSHLFGRNPSNLEFQQQGHGQAGLHFKRDAAVMRPRIRN